MAKKKKQSKEERKRIRLQKGKQWLITYQGTPKHMAKHYRERGCPDGGQGLAGAGSKLYAGAAGQYKAFRRGKAASEALEKREETAGRNAAEL